MTCDSLHIAVKDQVCQFLVEATGLPAALKPTSYSLVCDWRPLTTRVHVTTAVRLLTDLRTPRTNSPSPQSKRCANVRLRSPREQTA